MSGTSVPGHLFRDTSMASAVNTWLSNDAGSQERAMCQRFVNLMCSGTSVSGRPSSARPYPGQLPQQDTTAEPLIPSDSNLPQASGQRSKLHQRPSTASATSKSVAGGHTRHTPPRPASAAPTSLAASIKASASDWITTNEQFYGFRQLYPEIYAAAAEASKARPAPNVTFKSEYADSLKTGPTEYWKNYLVSTYESTNRSIYPPGPDSQGKTDQQGFFNWMKNQRLYYGELLSETAAARLDSVLESAPPHTKVELLAILRMIFAIVRPDRNKSTTHFMHGDQRAITEPFYEALQKEVIKVRTMGPGPATVNQDDAPLQHKAKQRPPAFAGAESRLRKAAGGGAVWLDKDTLAGSKLPLKWPGVTGMPCTTYKDTICETGTKAVRAARNRRPVVKPVVITCPMGDCDVVTDISRFTRFAVPESYLQPSTLPFQQAARNPPETTNRMVFQKRSADDIAKSMAFAAMQVAQAQKAKNKSTIPLGKGGCNLPHDNSTEKSRSYHVHSINTASNHATLRRARLSNNGPTSTVGVTLGGWQLP